MTFIERLQTSELDDKSYRFVRLSNKVEALLVHDSNTDKASVTMSVEVDNFSDLDDRLDTAHAMKHLLFMSSEKIHIYDKIDTVY